MQAKTKLYDTRYDGKKRFISYWYQAREVMNEAPSKILEVGIGNGFLSNYLQRNGYRITTVDIDEGLDPDHVASVLALPFQTNAFDVVACCEVLEHLPYDKVEVALEELCRVAKRTVVISVPDAREVVRIRLPLLGTKLVPLPKLASNSSGCGGEHRWEVGKKGYPLRRVTESIQRAGFAIEKQYRIPENPYHRMFVLSTYSWKEAITDSCCTASRGMTTCTLRDSQHGILATAC